MALTQDDARLDAMLEYTTDDDGVWLVLGTQRRNLGFFATVADALDAAETFTLDDAKGTA